MTPLRAVNLLVAGVATAAAVVVGEPYVFRIMIGCGLVLVIVGAGSTAADAFPFQRLGFACSALTIPAGLVVGLSAVISLSPLLTSMIALALQITPVAGKLRT
jgi:hypothetical protein